MQGMSESPRFGTVAVVGRPNVGKSTLVNALVGEHLCAVTPKAQTTRHRILGLRVHGNAQIALLDTPGLHSHRQKALNRVIHRTATASLIGVDLVLLVVEAGRDDDEDRLAFRHVAESGSPWALLINKIDRLADRRQLLPLIDKLTREFSDPREPEFVLPLSATKGDNVDALLDELAQRLPEGEHVYAAEQYTDRSERFLAAELIREQVMLRLRDELPYATTVEIEQFIDTDTRSEVNAVIWVARESQKGIVIGKGGEMLKEIGTAARLEIKRLLGRPVHLKLWCRVRKGWQDDEKALRQLGYGADD